MCAETSLSKFEQEPSVKINCDSGTFEENQMNLLMFIQGRGDNFEYPVLK